MRSSMIALSLVFVFSLGCGEKKKKKKADACTTAKGEAADKWRAAVKAWGEVDKGWHDPELIKLVSKDLHKKADGPVAKTAANLEMKSFEGYVTFKKAHAKNALEAAKAAHLAIEGKDMGAARKKAVRAFIVAADKSGIRSRKSPWFTNPNVVALDERQLKAYNLVTEGRSLSKKAEQTCAK